MRVYFFNGDVWRSVNVSSVRVEGVVVLCYVCWCWFVIVWGVLYSNNVLVAQWIRHPPTKREIAGSSPVEDFSFLFHPFLLHYCIYSRYPFHCAPSTLLGDPLPFQTLTIPLQYTTILPLHGPQRSVRTFFHVHLIHTSGISIYNQTLLDL